MKKVFFLSKGTKQFFKIASGFSVCKFTSTLVSVVTLRMSVIVFTSFFLVVAEESMSQDFLPGEQAQGYLKNSNTSVDKATGLFNYSMPLFEIKSGDYRVPLTLSYCSVKKETNGPRGITGFGWNVQTGGVITRTIRGGIADETPRRGYIFCPPQDERPHEYDKLVNMHVYDGESDLFTAILNGRRVHFIIQKKDDSIEAIPLERSNVKITCEYDGKNIIAWQVLDDNGVEYNYRETECLLNVHMDANVLTNSIRDTSYVSSWYLNKIKVPNGPDVIYTYDTVETDSGTVAGKVLFAYNDLRRTDFMYEMPLVQLSLQMGDFDEEFHRCIESISMKLNARYALALWGNLAYENTNLYHEFYTSEAELEEMIQKIIAYESVMGMATRYPSRINITCKYTALLMDLHNKFIRDSEICDLIYKALDIIRLAMNTNVLNTGETTLWGDVKYIVSTPKLNKIRCGDQEILFNIDDTGYLKDVCIRDYKGNPISRIKLEYDSGYLSTMRWHGNDGQVYQEQGLSYHDKLLSKIRFTTGGEIEIVYEPLLSDMPDCEGVRVKSIISNSFVSGADTVRYRYPFAGISVFDDISYRDTIPYTYTHTSAGELNFSDKILSSKLYYKGNACLNTGNNGIYYHYVEEELVGKGTNTYLYSVARPSKNNRDRRFSYWVNGLPLAQASYDINGRLVSLRKNRYYTDYSVTDFSFGKEWFDASPNASFKYSSELHQLNFDENDVRTSLLMMTGEKAPRVFIGYDWDPIIGWHEWYFNPTIINSRNIEYRSNQLTNPYYRLMYGGKTVLRSTKEYMVTNSTAGLPSINHLTGNLPAGAFLMSEVDYCYDNSTCHTNPTRVIHAQSNGDRLIVVRRTPLDILPNSTYPFISEMKAANVVAPVIKEQRILQKLGTYKFILFDESVTKYEKRIKQDGREIFVPIANCQFNCSKTLNVPPPTGAVDTELFAAGSESYRENIIEYAEGNQAWLPSEYRATDKKHAYCYDMENNSLVLDAINVNRQQVDAVDKYRVLCNSNQASVIPNMDGSTLPGTLLVTPSADDKVYRLVILVKPTGNKLGVSYTVNRAGNNSTMSIERTVKGGLWQTVVFDIPTNGVSSLRVQLPTVGMASASLAPLGVVFEARSYEPSGRLFATYDQNGTMKRQEYDGGGRVTRVYNGLGDLLQSYEYKTLY